MLFSFKNAKAFKPPRDGILILKLNRFTWIESVDVESRRLENFENFHRFVKVFEHFTTKEFVYFQICFKLVTFVECQCLTRMVTAIKCSY